MSTQSQRALLLRRSVAEFERRVNTILDYEETHPQATLAGISLQAVQLAVHDLRRLTSEERPLSQLMVVAIGDDVVWHEGGDPAALVSAHRQSGQRILIVPVRGHC